MINTIVVPLDGSHLSQAALPIANELAAALDSSIELLASGWGTTVEELIGYLDDQGASLTVPFKSSVVPDTFPATAIANAVNAPDDAIVMGTHGRTGFGKVLLGSVAEDVLKRSNNPVLLIGPGAKPYKFQGNHDGRHHRWFTNFRNGPPSRRPLGQGTHNVCRRPLRYGGKRIAPRQRRC